MRVGAGLGSPKVAAVAAFGAGLAATAIAFAVQARAAVDEQQEQVARRAIALAHAVQDRFRPPIESMRAVASLVAATGAVTGDVFSRFARDEIRREPLVYALEWAPRVARGERAAFESAARADGLDGYRIVDPTDGGALVPSPDRDVYYPLRYIVPMNRGLGIDLGGGPETASMRACASDHAVASALQHLAEDPPGVGSAYAVQPVWANGGTGCDAVTGFVVLVFRTSPVIREVMSRDDVAELSLVVRDLSNGGAVVAESSPGAAAAVTAATGDVARAPIAFVDRRWELAAAPRVRPALPWWLVAVGLMIALVLAAAAAGAATWRRMRRRLDQALKLGQYHLEAEIGRGGMGVVFRARHDLLRRATALKLLTAPDGDDGAIARFEREVRHTAELTHPNTISIFDYGRTPDGQFYYAMEYIDGLTLHEVLEHDGPLPIARAAHIVAQIAAALVEAHERGLVHRDLKPSNLMISTRGGVPDFVKVLDFGLVKRIDADADDASADHAMIGTPGYTAPEVLRGAAVDQRADLYSLGIVWYALLTARVPFGAGQYTTVLAAQLEDNPQPITELRDDLPPALAALVMRCFAAEPDARPAGAQALLDELAALALPAWTVADAEAWWRDRGPAVMRARGAAVALAGRAPRTVSIDAGDLRTR